jgi:hypothetical protein
MAIPSGAVETYDQEGIREDLSNVIHDISPVQTPFMSNARRGSADQTLHEWQTDDLDSADEDNAQIEGDDAPAPNFVATVKLANICQISTKTVIISGTADAVRKAGRRSETGYQIAKKAKELKRDMEAVLTRNRASEDGSSGVARKLGPLETWIITNFDKAGDGTNGTYSAGGVLTARDPGTQRPFKESQVKSVLRDAWNVGGEPDFVMVGPFNKQVFSGFTGNATRTDESEDKKLTAAIDVYQSDFGDVKIVPNRFQQERSAFILDLNLWSVDYLRPYFQKKLADTGDSTKRELIVEYTLKSCQEKGSGAVFDINAS